jgi:NAD(P)-dependent dehydrogenase (short-subunit alcohol dehydrogenase family)
MKIEGKVAIVTGAGGGGQGRAVALRLASLGARVVVSDVNESGGQETCSRIHSQGGGAAFVRADVANEADVKAICDFAEGHFGGLDIMVNNAGPYLPGDRLAGWKETLNANLFGSIYGTLYAIEPMRRRGGGAIVYYGSTSAMGHGLKHCASPAYDVAKGAVVRLATTMSWLREAYGIRVNCIVPDWVATEEVRAYFDSLSVQERVAHGVPEELTSLDDIASAVVRLITDEALSGRILVWWSGQAPGLIPVGDAGYGRLEPFQKNG